MAAITNPPTPSSLTSNGSQFQSPYLSAKQRLAILIQAKLVLLNYKGGTNYTANHAQLTIDAEAAYKGLTPDAWGASSGQTDTDLDPGAYTVGQFVQQANFRNSALMPTAIASVVTLLSEQLTRPSLQLQKQMVFVDELLLSLWG